MTTKPAKHFTYDELACKCCGQFKMDSVLLRELDALREYVSRPIIIHSGYRCPKHPDWTKGSSHDGRAVDFHIETFTLPEMYFVTERRGLFRNGGIGVYPDGNFIHADMRVGHARWAKIGGIYTDIAAAFQVASKLP